MLDHLPSLAFSFGRGLIRWSWRDARLPPSRSLWRPSSQAPKRVRRRVKPPGGVKYFIRVGRATGRALACGNDVESEVNRARAGAVDPPEFGFERRPIRLHSLRQARARCHVSGRLRGLMFSPSPSGSRVASRRAMASRIASGSTGYLRPVVATLTPCSASR